MDEKIIEQQFAFAKESINTLNSNQKYIQKDIIELNKKFDKVLSILTDPKVNEELAKASQKKLLKG